MPFPSLSFGEKTLRSDQSFSTVTRVQQEINLIPRTNVMTADLVVDVVVVVVVVVVVEKFPHTKMTE